MVGVSTPELAAAVSNAGGLGSLGLGASTPEKAEKIIIATRKLTDKPFNVNFFCHKPVSRNQEREQKWIGFLEPAFRQNGSQPPKQLNEIYKSFVEDEDMFRMLLRQKPAVISFHFGIPKQHWIDELRKNGSFTMATATSLHEARTIADSGMDAVVAQGIEAGGHRGIFDTDAHDSELSTAELVELLASSNLGIPVVAASGIMNGSDISEMLSRGADAAQLGTAFVLCPESGTNASYRQKLQAAEGETCVTSVISGRPARGIVTPFIEDCQRENAPPPAEYPLTYDLNKQLNSVDRKGSKTGDFAAYWAGTNYHVARSMPAALLVRTLVEEMGAE
ncbi:DEKNAAC103784 [Brettanomyces naardenensis]|uniref:DEKNAAC103784 n=1 Tax=Brettanomyces naardenensis TaxID=13370 RepID=A0A448YP63_BRENA|nr:DEKNAAC103784 [Brettanomyces naardenensis]